MWEILRVISHKGLKILKFMAKNVITVQKDGLAFEWS
jgi:hypothetical protein